MYRIKTILFRSKEFEELGKRVEALSAETSCSISGAAGSLLAFVVARVFERRGAEILLVAPDEDTAEKLRDDCALLLGEGAVRYFGARPVHHAQALDLSASISQIETIKSLAAGERTLVIASPESIVQRVPAPDRFRGSVIEVRAGSTTPFGGLIERLEAMGFERKDFVEGYGDVAVRGGILDVFPFVGENPIRLEFWGDTIESIREFDALSQRSIRQLTSASIVPSFHPQEVVAGDGDAGTRQLKASLLDFLSENALVLFDDPISIRKAIDEQTADPPEEHIPYDEFIHSADRFARIYHSPWHASDLQILEDADEIAFRGISQPSFNGSINVLVDSIRKYDADGYAVFLTCDTPEEARRLQDLIEEEITAPHERREEDASVAPGIPSGNVRFEILKETVHSGFVSGSARLAVFTEHEIFGRVKRRGAGKKRRFKGFSQRELQQLKRGDYVVHVDHGIGTFAGLTKITVGGVEQEVMRLFFLENDVLYVNLNALHRVQKYSSQEGHVPKLSKLGGVEWDRITARAKRRLKDIARDIIALYARRKHENGFAFSPDTHWQKELEASFMYEDTVDQATATIDVKNDMESPAPMDRLICGDVGFGKTEVAVRAAFKAVMDGKQVAILVPTTILAIQHFNTFQDRLSRYTTRVEQITRFRSKAEQTKIAEGLKAGAVDIVIGTHRLLSADIGFKDLGLLIIDEEHRFGVAAKEKLRKLKATVDTLTLTATPIPRTLHFSLIGARDLSLIGTPPRNRLPIATEIVPADGGGRQIQWDVIREAITKELHRGGQAYFVHDRVGNIDAIADQVKAHVPAARVRSAHGQMPGHRLEKTMLEFLEKKFDVLVCTKIIESGLDIPSVNTIVINRADRFGLAELYQLRGRVGRSNIQAYAYLMTPPLSAMPKQSLRRLQAVEEFTELGSGFNLAMRDLEIRGAGNLLGGEQSGFILEMGFEMYERILREAVDELKQEEFSGIFGKEDATRQSSVATETVIDADIDALVPDIYVESDTERLDIYRRLYRASSEEELGTMQEELRDRFGELPPEVTNLMKLVELRMLGSAIGIPKISLNKRVLAITLPEETDIRFYGESPEDDSPFQRILKHLTGPASKGVRLKQEGKSLVLEFVQSDAGGTEERLHAAKTNLEIMRSWIKPESAEVAKMQTPADPRTLQ